MELIELYEYKVADVLAGRVPRGGAHALNDLRDTLLKAPLEAPLLQRMMVTDRQYRAWRDIHESAAKGGEDNNEHAEHLIVAPEAGTVTEPQAASSIFAADAQSKRADYGLPEPELPDITNMAAATVDDSEGGILLSQAAQDSIFGHAGAAEPDDFEQPQLSVPQVQADAEQAWQELCLLSWYDELYKRILQESLQARNEPARPFLRIMYSTIENLDVLGSGSPLHRVPDAADNNLRLHDEQVVTQKAEQFCSALLTPEGRKRVVLILDHLYEEPLARQAGEMSQDVEFNPFERPLLRGAAQQLRSLLDQYLSELPLLLDSTLPEGKIFYTEPSKTADASANVVPSDRGDELVIYLGDEAQSLRWRNVVLTWQLNGVEADQATSSDQSLGKYWLMHGGLVQTEASAATSNNSQPVAQQVIKLYPQDPSHQRIYVLRNGALHLQILLSGKYALMRLRTQPEQELGLLAVQARALSLMLKPDENYAYLRLARALARYLRTGELAPSAESENVDNYTHAPADALQSFVRKGLSTLNEYMQHKEPKEIADALLGCAKSLNLSDKMAPVLHEALHNAAFNSEGISEPMRLGSYNEAAPVRLNGVFQSYHLERLPMNLDLQEGRMMTLQKDYRGEMVALLPGHPAVSLERVAAVHVGTLSVMMVRQEQWLAVAAHIATAEATHH